MYIPDNYDVFAAHDREKERRLSNLPKCEYCGNTIQDEYFYIINDENICEDCMKSEFRKSVEDYIE